jgi:hypothetical protein
MKTFIEIQKQNKQNIIATPIDMFIANAAENYNYEAYMKS